MYCLNLISIDVEVALGSLTGQRRSLGKDVKLDNYVQSLDMRVLNWEWSSKLRILTGRWEGRGARAG